MNNKKKYSHDLVRVKKIRSLLINLLIGQGIWHAAIY